MSKKLNPEARAVVELRVEVQLGARWGAACTVQQVLDQAAREAESTVRARLKDVSGVRVVGGPRVVTVVMDGES